MTLIPRNHRRLIPPMWGWGVLCFLVLVVEAPVATIAVMFGVSPLEGPMLGQGLATISGFAGGGYAVWRVLGFHPFRNKSYRQWLRATPWQPGEPLPLGPLQLTLTDFVLIGLLSIPGLFTEMPGIPAIAFLVAWPCTMAIEFAGQRMIRQALAILFLLSLPVVTIGVLNQLVPKQGTEWLDSVLLVVFPIPLLLAIIVCHLNLRRSLVEMCKLDDSDNDLDNISTLPKKTGWPVRELAAERPQWLPLERLDTVLVSLATGWLLLGIGLIAQMNPGNQVPPDEGFLMGMMMMPSVMIGIVRLGFYISGTRPSLSLWGRLIVGPLVQWKYDRAFVKPILGCLTSFLLLAAGFERLLPIELAFPLAVMAAMLINGLGGPDIATFRLTGTHRLSLPLIQTKDSVKLTS